MVSDKKYKFGTSVFRIVSPCLLKENASYRSFLAEDTVKEEVEITETRIKREEYSKLKTYEILILYIIFLINSISIIEQI